MKFQLLLLSLLLFIGCTPPLDKDLIKGKWKTSEWKIVNTNQVVDSKMDFDFMEGKRYTVDYGSETENGKYWIANAFLHTVEDGMTEKKVKITKLTTDSLCFEMNRAGRLESVILLKEN